MKPYVFISYIPEDADRVDRLLRALTAAGIQVWHDKAVLLPGQDRRQQIRQAITGDALIFIACFSKASLARVRSYQNEEFNVAIEEVRKRRPDQVWFIPVRFDECQIPDWDIGGGRTLRSLEYADLFSDRFDRDLARLIAVIDGMLGSGTAAAAASAPDIAKPDIDLSADDKQLLLDEMANVYSIPARAGLLLDRVGFQRQSRPAFYSGEAPIQLWSEVFIEFDRGIIETPYRRLLHAASREYPANQTFRSLAHRYLSLTR